MRRPRPEILFSSAALIVSVLTLISSTIWSRAAARDDELRAERRAAYSQYIGATTRCSPGLAARDDADLTVDSTVRLARVNEEVTACQADLGAASSIVTLLSDDDGLVVPMGVLEDTLLKLAAVRYDMAAATDEAALDVVPARAGGSCAADEYETLVLEYVGCGFRVGAQQALFLAKAREDVQRDPPDLVDVAVGGAPWFIGSAALLGLALLVLRRRDGAASGEETSTATPPAPSTTTG